MGLGQDVTSRQAGAPRAGPPTAAVHFDAASSIVAAALRAARSRPVSLCGGKRRVAVLPASLDVPLPSRHGRLAGLRFSVQQASSCRGRASITAPWAAPASSCWTDRPLASTPSPVAAPQTALASPCLTASRTRHSYASSASVATPSPRNSGHQLAARSRPAKFNLASLSSNALPGRKRSVRVSSVSSLVPSASQPSAPPLGAQHGRAGRTKRARRRPAGHADARLLVPAPLVDRP